MYRKIGVCSVRVAELIAAELSANLVQARVRWALNDAGGMLLYDFDTTYILGRFEGTLKIASAVSHNEIARYRACIARLGA